MFFECLKLNSQLTYIVSERCGEWKGSNSNFLIWNLMMISHLHILSRSYVLHIQRANILVSTNLSGVTTLCVQEIAVKPSLLSCKERTFQFHHVKSSNFSPFHACDNFNSDFNGFSTHTSTFFSPQPFSESSEIMFQMWLSWKVVTCK